MSDKDFENYQTYLNGDEQGLVNLIVKYRIDLTLYLYAIVRDMFAAEELAEDTFVKIGIKKPRFVKKASFKTWLYTIGKNLALDYLKKQKNNEFTNCNIDEEIASLLEEQYIKNERDRIIHSSLDMLKPNFRQIIWLRYFEGLSIDEISTIMKISKQYTRVVESRAKQALREILKKEGIDNEDF